MITYFHFQGKYTILSIAVDDFDLFINIIGYWTNHGFLKYITKPFFRVKFFYEHTGKSNLDQTFVSYYQYIRATVITKGE